MQFTDATHICVMLSAYVLLGQSEGEVTHLLVSLFPHKSAPQLDTHKLSSSRAYWSSGHSGWQIPWFKIGLSEEFV